MKILISDSISSDLKDLFWSVFFESKNRGISLGRHFPWLDNSLKDVVFIEAQISSITIGGLVVRKAKYNINHEELQIGLIGLVCVATSNRGTGIATALLTATVNYCKNRNLSYLTLWTNQHQVYSKHNFYVQDPWQFGWVQTEKCIVRAYRNRPNIGVVVTEMRSSPLPPFATAIYEYSLKNLSFIMLKDSDGDIVISYEGDADDMGLFMINLLPERWRLNVVKDDPLLSVLEKHGACLNLFAVNLQMWLDLNNNDNSRSIIEKIAIPILDRI